MKCSECGAKLPGNETCQERFNALLVAERGAAGKLKPAFDIQSLTLMTYYLQHAGSSGYTKHWMVEFAKDSLRQLFVEERDPAEVFPTGIHPARQKAAAAKAIPRAKEPVTTSLGPQPGELTIADLDPAELSDDFEQVLGWAKSVARYRVLNPH